MKLYSSILFVFFLFITSTGSAMEGMDHGDTHMSGKGHSHETMGHSSSAHSGHFKHAGMVDGIDATFQVMSLASMKMKDPEGKTHHIMVSFFHKDQKLNGVSGDIKVISPSGKEQVGELMHFGGGMYAANFIFDEAGKWDITCNFTDQGRGHSIHFMYPHNSM
ncbi:hypothetical protein [Desulfogranum japonicum]|uniref:hypothetical protein n=1 Tax=Desulfogranum japonicum TaxID=231447 RepID=UPI000428DB30|nr:hypothetical protein [Desulfogranum japonicum]